jgi:hypothetical protein
MRLTYHERLYQAERSYARLCTLSTLCAALSGTERFQMREQGSSTGSRGQADHQNNNQSRYRKCVTLLKIWMRFQVELAAAYCLTIRRAETY